MKKILSFLILAFVGLSLVIAQPQKMTYQTVVRDANNNLVVNQQVGLEISIFEDNANGPLVYSETHTANTNANGLVSVIVGTGIHAYPTSLADVQWGEHDHYLRVDIDPTGGVNYTITGTTQLMTVPYAFYAGSVRYADTALYLKNFSDTAKYSIHSDTANYAYNAGIANSAAYADSTRVSDYAYNAGTANNAIYSDSSRVSNFAHIADFNKLLNRPTGTNMGDILYWDTLSATWHILPVGSIGEVLTLDSNYVPQWNTGGGASCNLPTVVTNPVNNYTGYDANVSGAVTNGGGTQFVVGGFCWSQNANPTISDPYSMDGIGATSFTHNITGLNLGTTYHFRAYGMNAAGVAYGADETFTTWDYPAVTTYPTVSTISATTAYCGGTVTSDGGNYVSQRGVCWNTWGSPDIDNNEGMTSDGGGTGSFTSYMTGLQEGTTYYVCAYATNDIGTVYGSTITFTTLSRPSVNTNNVTDIDTMSAVSGGNVYADGGDPVTGHGIVWGTYSWIDLYNNNGSTSHGAGTVPFNFTDTMKNLTPGQYYYVRAYATNSIGTGYGSSEQFRVNPVKPTVTTTPISYYDSYSAEAYGNVTYNGGDYVSSRGVCWNTTGSPTMADSYTTNGSGTGNFYCWISGLNPGTTYYVRAFATNSAGTAYGNEVSFTTNATLPTVTTSPISDTSATYAVAGGNVTSDGGDSVTARGLIWVDEWNYWSCPNFYNYYDGSTTTGAGKGIFSDTMQTFTPGHYYYYSAYATNSVGTSYGTCYYFKAKTTVPTVVTNATVTNILGASAVCGGNVTNDGGEYVSSRGLCWNTTGNPTLADSYQQYGSGTGSFSLTMNGLSDSTTYWVCAYATNINGTSYGTPVSFTTAKLPTVVTEPVIDVTTTGAYSGVTVLADGGNSVSVSGVCWSTSPNPTISNSKSLDGSSGVIPFTKTSLIFDLDDTTTYYVRAYATTDMGTGYGQAISFTTHAFPACPGVTTVSDTDGNVYSTVLIGTQCWMRENLRTTKYPDGTNIAAGVVTETAVGFRYGAGTSPRGYLYNYVALMHGASPSNSIPSGVQGICPNGWHIPSYMEWQILYNYVNSLSSWVCSNGNNGRALASKTAWYQNSSYKAGCYISAYERPNSTRNISGLGLLPYGSYRQDGSSIHNQNYNCYIWSCSKTGTSIYCNYGNYGDYSFYQTTVPEYYGLSVRCIKDYTPPVANYVSPCPNATSVSDNDGHTYNTVQIGTQCWMKENLRTTKYPDGTQITYGYGNNTSTQIGYYYHVSNNSSNDATYGLMYNWVAAMDSSTTEGAQGICPQGWHIPTYNEYNYLKYYVLIHSSCGEGQALAATTNWTTYSDNSCSVGYNLTNNNASGFSLQPAGYYYYCCGTGDVKNTAEIWSSTESSATYSYRLYLYYTSTQASVGTENNGYGLSVRCIKD